MQLGQSSFARVQAGRFGQGMVAVQAIQMWNSISLLKEMGWVLVTLCPGKESRWVWRLFQGRSSRETRWLRDPCVANETCFDGSRIQSAWLTEPPPVHGLLFPNCYPHSLFCRKGAISPSETRA